MPSVMSRHRAGLTSAFGLTEFFHARSVGTPAIAESHSARTFGSRRALAVATLSTFWCLAASALLQIWTGESDANRTRAAMAHCFRVARREKAACASTFPILFGLLLVYGMSHPPAARAACVPNGTGSGITINYFNGIASSGALTPPAQVSPAVGAGQNTNNSIINILPGTALSGTNLTSLSVGNGNTINIGNATGGASVITTTNNGVTLARRRAPLTGH